MITWVIIFALHIILPNTVTSIETITAVMPYPAKVSLFPPYGSNEFWNKILKENIDNDVTYFVFIFSCHYCP